MAAHNDLGRTGEDLAEVWLIKKGYKILHRNWTLGQNEVDIIATKGKFLHFIEIKTRNYSPYMNPEDSVGRNKFRSMQRVADNFLYRFPQYEWIQYDVLAITLLKDGEAEYFLIEDIYY